MQGLQTTSNSLDKAGSYLNEAEEDWIHGFRGTQVCKKAEPYMKQLHTYYLQKYLGTKLHSPKFKPSRTSLNE